MWPAITSHKHVTPTRFYYYHYMGWWPGDSPICSLTRVFLQANVSFCACQFGPRGFLVWWVFYMRICTYVEYLNFGFLDWRSLQWCAVHARNPNASQGKIAGTAFTVSPSHVCTVSFCARLALFRKTRVWQRKKRWDLDVHNTSFLFLFGQRCLLPPACKGARCVWTARERGRAQSIVAGQKWV